MSQRKTDAEPETQLKQLGGNSVKLKMPIFWVDSQGNDKK